MDLMDAYTLARRGKTTVEEVLYWTKVGALRLSQEQGGEALYDFSALVALRSLKRLRELGVSVRRIKEIAKRLWALLPTLTQPFAQVKFEFWGQRLIIHYDRRKFDLRGQLLLELSPPGAPKAVIPHPKKEESLFFEALKAEEDGDYERAQKLYLEILSYNSRHADSLVNLGNIEFTKGSLEAAEALYRKALEVDPDHVEANYNLACVLEEKGKWQEALLFYKKALHEDPDFPEAHFNLARLLQLMGRTGEAREHWRRYLELDPQGPWADWARRFLL